MSLRGWLVLVARANDPSQLAAGDLGLTLGNEELSASSGLAAAAAPADVVHAIVVQAWQRVHPPR